MANESTTKNRHLGLKIFTLILVLLVIALLAAGGFFYKQYRETRNQRNNFQAQNADLNKQLNAFKADPEKAGKAEAEKYIAEVGKLYDLPKDELPVFGTVNDVNKLPKDPPFFAKAAKGDITLIYAKNKLGILYRPSTEQIINVGSVTIQDDKPANPSANP